MDSLLVESIAACFPPLTFLARVLPFPLVFLTIVLRRRPEFHSTERCKKKCCNAMLFPGNLDLLSQTLGGPVVPLVCGFIRRYIVCWGFIQTGSRTMFLPKGTREGGK